MKVETDDYKPNEVETVLGWYGYSIRVRTLIEIASEFLYINHLCFTSQKYQTVYNRLMGSGIDLDIALRHLAQLEDDGLIKNLVPGCLWTIAHKRDLKAMRSLINEQIRISMAKLQG